MEFNIHVTFKDAGARRLYTVVDFYNENGLLKLYLKDNERLWIPLDRILEIESRAISISDDEIFTVERDCE
jgi:hypothetical protein